MVGGWRWYSEEDKIQLRTPDIYLGVKKKGKILDNSKILHKNPTESEIEEFYKSETVNLEHIVSRISVLFDLTCQSSPIAVLGHYIARLALLDTNGDKSICLPDNKKTLHQVLIHDKPVWNLNVSQKPWKNGPLQKFYSPGFCGQ